MVAFAADPMKPAKLKGSNMGSGMRICCFCHNSMNYCKIKGSYRPVES
jgi:hypothetical protein